MAGKASLSRREVVLGGMAGAIAIAGMRAPGAFAASGAAGRDAVDHVLRAAPQSVELGGRTAATWTYGRLPGPELRLRQGRRVRIRVENGLPEETSVHWHGIRLANAMDGVPGITQRPIAPGGSFVYDFVPPDAGTYFFHPHVGLQADRGLYGALVVEAQNEPLAYDDDVTIVLDDWLDGIAGRTPEQAFASLERKGMGGMGGMDMGGMQMDPVAGPYVDLARRRQPVTTLAGLANALEGGSDGGDVKHPLLLINGRPADDPWSLRVRRGNRIRLRLINAAADTIFSFRIGGHALTVVACDGQAVDPVETDAVVLGMGERIDVLLEARGSGAHQIVAKGLGKGLRVSGVLRYSSSPTASVEPAATTGLRVASYENLRSSDPGPAKAATRTIRLPLGMSMADPYVWTIGGQAYPAADPVLVRKGETVDLVVSNGMTMMAHPMHLHGNLFSVVGAGGRPLLKDTVTIPAMQSATLRLTATNPGRWLFHCHNDYHMMAGMMRELRIA